MGRDLHCSDADYFVTVISESNPTARKPHKCSECYREIRVGEPYHREAITGDGLSTVKTCNHCTVVRGYFVRNAGGYIYGGMLGDLCDQDDSGDGLVDALRTGMQSKWVGEGGDLLPLPKIS